MNRSPTISRLPVSFTPTSPSPSLPPPSLPSFMCVRVLCVPAVCLGIACVLIASAGRAAAEQTVRFSRDVLPLLSDRCFHCHGPDESHREAGLRLDEREAALDAGAIVPGDPDASELIARVTSDDADLLMPPADAHRQPLSDQEIETLRRWIAEGAPWGKHWAFEVPARPEVPAGYEH